MSSPTPNISANLDTIRKRIQNAAATSGRDPNSIRLIAVSKYMPGDYIQQAILAGQRCFGENTLQDAQSKQALIDDPATEWHFIGHLQSNKAKHIPGNFDWLHTLDSLKLLQVNIANDPDKFGLPADSLFQFIEELLSAELSGIHLRGLMMIGHRDATVAERRRDFSALYELGQNCATRFGTELFSEYSMGMSGDFEDAIAEGATMIRVGTAIFGPRPQPRT